ncbi:MAG: antiterminator LoaP [Firmicutes bacterium]|nr:antiterminator LoaP [Bacillota bacterium]
MGNWFVFFVQTGREQTACDFLNKLFDRTESIAFIPQVQLIFKNSKIIRKELKPMFPGYVFTDSELDERTFITQASRFARFSKCIFKLLYNESIDYMKVAEDEKNFLLSLCDDRYVAEESKGFIIGDKIFVTSGPLQCREGIIRKIDRHKRHAEIEMTFLGDKRRVSVSLEIVSKIL